MLVILTDRHWRSLLDVTGVTDTIAALQNTLDADFSLERVRDQYRVLISDLLEPWFAARPLTELPAALEGTRILLSVYWTFDEVAADLADGPPSSSLTSPASAAISPRPACWPSTAATGRSRPLRNPASTPTESSPT